MGLTDKHLAYGDDIPQTQAEKDYYWALKDLKEKQQVSKKGTVLPKGHGKKFEEIVVEYPPADLCIYPEYKGKAYFSIKYEENGEHIIGFGTYSPEVLSMYLREYFIMPTIIESNKEVVNETKKTSDNRREGEDL